MADATLRPRPRGAIPTSRHKLAAAMPYRIRGATPPQFIVIPKKLSYWLNDTYGDCVTAEEAFAKACASVQAGSPEVFIGDNVVESWARRHGVLNGADLTQVMDFMRQDGFVQAGERYDDGPYNSVDYTHDAILQNAIANGPVKLGVAAGQLENVVGNSNGWFGLGFSDDPNEDHSTSLCGYGPMDWLANQLGVHLPAHVDPKALGYAMFTWSTIGILDAASMRAITGEAWLRNPTTVAVPASQTPAESTLLADLLVLAAAIQKVIADLVSQGKMEAKS